MNPLVMFMVSGGAFWASLFMLATGTLLTIRQERWWQRTSGRLLAVVGWLFLPLSSTPLPSWLAWTLFLALATLLLFLHFPAAHRSGRVVAVIRAILLTAILLAGVVEQPHCRIPVIPGGPHRRLAVLGDSITAGIGFPGEVTWPEVFTTETGIPFAVMAVGGGTYASALADVPRIPPETTLVLLAIGGNDILGHAALPRFAQDLEKLLAAMAATGRTTVMLEIPALPGRAGFIAAQRRLARQYHAVLIPRRVFAGFITGHDFTRDGLHLSNRGHARMARRLAHLMRPALDISSHEAVGM